MNQTLRNAPPHRPGKLGMAAFALAWLLLTSASQTWAQAALQSESNGQGSGAVRLRQPTQADLTNKSEANRRTDGAPNFSAPSPPEKPTDFEVYVRKLVGGSDVRRFGAEAILGIQTAPRADANLRQPSSYRADTDFGAQAWADATDYNPLIPPDYLLRSGDELVVTLWGSVDADLRLQVDRSGRISIPRVGPVMISGVRYADLRDVISRRVALVFKNFEISVTLGQLRGMRVYVTGFVIKPGSVVVTSLSTLAQALTRAGGPTAAGSFRNIQLRRGRDLVTHFDLYDLLLKGDRTADQLLQADDVIHVDPVGAQVAIIGNVNRSAIFEIKPGESIEDVLRMAGGFNAVADRTRLSIERLQDRNGVRVAQLELPADLKQPLGHGDVLRGFSAVDFALSSTQQSKRVRVEGEVQRAAEYLLPAASSLADALRAAGGLTTKAYVYAAEFNRESVRLTQQENYERVLRDLETDLARASSSQRVSSTEEASVEVGRSAAAARMIDRLKALRPSGRIVFQLPTDGTELPSIELEDGDRIFIPARASTVGIFGSVFNAASYLYTPGRTLDDYLRLAGGPTKGADQTSSFVVRANGSVISGLQTASGWFSRNSGLGTVGAEPGDTLFVPEELNKTTFLQSAKDWTLLLYQLGIGIAGIKSAIK